MSVATLQDLQGFHASTIGQRASAAAALESRLGEDWKAGDPTLSEDGLPFVHRPTQIRFVAVPGGSFDMGLSEEDIEEASEYIDWVSYVADWVDALAARTRPVHRVQVRPFLVARRPLSSAEARRLGASGSGEPLFMRDVARRLVRTHGFRLPSEVEFEWLARDAGTGRFLLDAARQWSERRDAALRSRFGLSELQEPHWVEDDWHPNYEGSPTESSPWMAGGDEGVRRGGFALVDMQDAQELLAALAAARFEGDERCVARLAKDIP